MHNILLDNCYTYIHVICCEILKFHSDTKDLSLGTLKLKSVGCCLYNFQKHVHFCVSRDLLLTCNWMVKELGSWNVCWSVITWRYPYVNRHKIINCAISLIHKYFVSTQVLCRVNGNRNVWHHNFLRCKLFSDFSHAFCALVCNVCKQRSFSVVTCISHVLHYCVRSTLSVTLPLR
jgi:hypothetical protein